MDIVSYRGEGAGGGVSSALKAAFDNFGDSKSRWWFLQNNDLSYLNGDARVHPVFNLEHDLVQGHYRYCNEFIWPLMHDLPQFAVFKDADRNYYREFNRKISQIQLDAGIGGKDIFIHDYQFAILPALLKNSQMSIFWHIPWPKNVPHHFSEPISELVLGMLSCAKIGFHTNEYAQNFIQLVHDFCPEYRVNSDELVIKNRKTKKLTRLLVRPLGLDLKFWKAADAKQNLSIELPDTPIILSVDRADYTKGIMQRLEMIDYFFGARPDYVGKLAFVQICQQTRPGLKAFDDYWQNCRDYAYEIEERYAVSNWKPLYWHTNPISQQELSGLYKRAQVMLVNPVRDGLNLTAKEYVASLDSPHDQNHKSGLLMLSSGAGVYDEFGDQAVDVNPNSCKDAAEALNYSLKMPTINRNNRINLMKQRLKTNSLEKWWHDFELTG